MLVSDEKMKYFLSIVTHKYAKIQAFALCMLLSVHESHIDALFEN